MKPALTPEEWAAGKDSARVRGDGTTDYDYGYAGVCSDGTLHINLWEYTYAGKDRHALAALALYGQPFGFSREDVRELRSNGSLVWMREWADSLADRIEALLPPEDK